METNEYAKMSNALVQAQSLIVGMSKDSTNAFHKYAYVSAESIVMEARKALNSAGLSVSRDYAVELRESFPHPFLRSRFVLSHSSGESSSYVTDWFIIEASGRPFDKALAGALTSSLAYFLRDLLLIPKQEEADGMDKRDDRTAKQQVATDRTLGVKGAVELRKKLTAKKLDLQNLVDAMKSKGVDTPEDLGMWSSTLLPRIEKWIETQKISGLPVSATQ